VVDQNHCDLISTLKLHLEKNSSIPLYKQILNILRARIASGECGAGMRLPTEDELSSELGVSRVTIRQALSAAVEEGWLVRTAGKGTFVAENTPQAIKRGSISYIVPHLSSSFIVQTLLGVESALKTQGYSLIFGNSENSQATENELLQRMDGEDIVGHIIWPVMAEGGERWLQRLIGQSKPVVLVDRSIPQGDCDVVMGDHFAGGQMAVAHLIEQGYTHIIYLAHPILELASIATRYRAYQEAMRAAGLTPAPAAIVGQRQELGYTRSPDNFVANESADVAEIIHLLRSPQRPQAIVAMNDLLALLVIEAAAQCGLQIPDDLALVGFDDLDYAQSMQLTTIAQDAYQIGVEAANLMLRRIQGESGAPQQVVVPVRLIQRASSIRRI
jgi:GntR family transcriptional regulator of arabinose operon